MRSKIELNQTLTEQALESLWQDIICSKYRPNERLNIESLKRSYNMGGTPIREALNQLVAHGLVIALPLKGFQVAPMSLPEARDLYQNRLELEASMLSQLLRQNDDEWEAGSVATAHRLKKLVQQKEFIEQPDIYRWMQAYDEYLFSYLYAIQSTWLVNLHRLLYKHIQRYEFYYYSHSDAPMTVFENDNDNAARLLSVLLDHSRGEVLELHKMCLLNRSQGIEKQLKDGGAPNG